MKILTEPKVHLLSVPFFLSHQTYILPKGDETDAEQIVATAGKVCYDSFGLDGRSVSDHIRSLVDSHHYSVLEHSNFGVFIEGISRGCSHELVRHRHFSFSQRSTRYTAEDDAAIVLDPYYASLCVKEDTEGLTLDEGALLHKFLIDCENALKNYRQQVEWLTEQNPEHLKGRDLRKWARGKARQLLPHALETRLVVTGNIRSWREFFEKRCSSHAEAEIRRLAYMIRELLTPLAPNAFADASTSS